MALPKSFLRGTLAGALLLAASCGTETPPEGGAGVLTFALTGSQVGEGAMLVDLTGSGIGELSAVDGDLFERRSGSSVRVFVVREDAGELRFAVELSDTLNVPRIDLIEVAGADNALRPSLSSYDVEVVR